jgi:hypothetical protein
VGLDCSVLSNNPLDEESRKVTAFSTRTQRVQFTRTPQGLRSSSWAFLSAVYDLFRQELRGNMAIYADDALLFNSSFQEHKKLLRAVLQKMKDKALRINPKKSKFATDRAIFLGFELSAHGLRIDPKRFQKSEICSLLQMLNRLKFYVASQTTSEEMCHAMQLL